MEKCLTQHNQENNASKFTSQSHCFHKVISVTGCLAAALWLFHRRAAHSLPGAGELVSARLLRGALTSQNKYTRMTKFWWNRKLFLSKIYLWMKEEYTSYYFRLSHNDTMNALEKLTYTKDERLSHLKYKAMFWRCVLSQTWSLRAPAGHASQTSPPTAPHHWFKAPPAPPIASPPTPPPPRCNTEAERVYMDVLWDVTALDRLMTWINLCYSARQRGKWNMIVNKLRLT